MKASDLFVKCLESEHVEYIFGLPGEENADLMMSLAESKIKFILTRHEQSAAFMADVYGRLTGKPGVCLATLGPGATNLTTGIANANMDRSRVVTITAQAQTNALHKESHQNMDVMAMFKPITKWSWSFRTSNSIPEVTRKAFKIATEEKPGATHIEIPVDIMKQTSRKLPVPIQKLHRFHPSSQLVKQAIEMILDAKKPLVLIGNGCIREDAVEAVRKFVTKSGICSINTFMGKGTVSDDHDRHLQTVGIRDADYAQKAIKNADMVISIGYDLVEYSPQSWNPELDKKIIHIDFTSAETDEYYPTDIELIGDIELTIDSLLRQLEIVKQENPSLDCYPCHKIPEIFAEIRHEIVKRITQFDTDLAYPIKPEKVIGDVRKVMSNDDVVISDVGVHKLWIAKMYQTYLPNTCIIPNGFAAMGFSIPGAIAAQMVHPDKTVIAMCGDGSFLMNVHEVETAVRLKLPIIIVVWCDAEYGLISLKQEDEFGKKVFTDFTNPDFVKLAESFNATGFFVDSTAKLSEVLQKAKVHKDRPTIIAVPVDYSRNETLLNDKDRD